MVKLMRITSVLFDGGKAYTLDEHGFLDPPEQWDPEFAEGMSKLLGISGGLTKEHWSFIKYLRKKFVDERTVPVVVQACSENGLRLRRFRYLFPTGYHRGACKIAGINYAFMYQSNIWLTYESYSRLEKEHKLTSAGFLEDFERWNERFAQLVASEWNLANGLTKKQWKIIRFLRDYYRDTRNIPSIFETCKSNKIGFSGLRKLFPDGYRRGACRIAGLPFLA